MTSPTNLNKLFVTIAMAACYAMVFIDQSGVAVTLAPIQKNLQISNLGLQWVMNGFLLTIAVLQLLGGKLADHYGRRRIFIYGITTFLLASIICASATSGWVLIAGRVLQGLGASLLIPCLVALISSCFPPEEYGKSLGTILALASFFFALGPFIGGAAAEYLSWRWIFWINIPIGALCLYFTFLAIPNDSGHTHRPRFDYKGLIIFIIAISALVFALMQGADWGWLSAKIISLIIIAIVGLLIFIRVELKLEHPLLQMHLFHNKTFLAGNIIYATLNVCVASIVFWALWLSKGLQMSPMIVGIAMLPTTACGIFMTRVGGKWADKAGARVPMLWGAALTIIAIFWLAGSAFAQSYAWFFWGLVFFGIGGPLIMPNSLPLAMSGIPPEQRGIASGVLATGRQVFLSLGLAAVGAVITNYESTHPYTPTSYSHAFAYSMLVAGIFSIIAGVVTFIFVPRKK